MLRILGFFASIFLILSLGLFAVFAFVDGVMSATPAGVIILAWIIGIWMHYQYIHKPKMLKLAAQAVYRKDQMWVPEPIKELRRAKPVSPGSTSVPDSSPGPKVPERIRRVSVLWRH